MCLVSFSRSFASVNKVGWYELQYPKGVSVSVCYEVCEFDQWCENCNFLLCIGITQISPSLYFSLFFCYLSMRITRDESQCRIIGES